MIGRMLAHYRITSAIGAGGMGQVYRATDTKLGRNVALKVLPPEMASSAERLERFRREAKALAALDHPGIVTVHSVEETDGVHYLTMQLVEGRPLDQVMPPGGMPLGRLLEIAVPLAEALAAAHDKRITHRDLKPSNVMITEDGRPMLLDFGLSKHGAGTGTASSQAPTEKVTKEGLVMGTLPYMSPEQVQGKTLDHRSDIFSFGIILHEMASGSRPFKGDSSADLVSSILRDPPPPLSEIRGDLPVDLARVVSRCLMKDPMARVQTARDVYNELRLVKQQLDSGQSMTSGASIVSSSVPDPERSKSWVLPAIGIGAAVVAVVLAVLYFAPVGERSGTGTVPPPGEAAAVDSKRLVVLPFENMGSGKDDTLAAGMAEEIISRLASVDGLGVISRKSAMSYAGTDKTIRQIGEELGVDYVMEGTIRWARSGEGVGRVRITPSIIRVDDDTQVWSETYDRVIEDIFDLQSEIATRVTEQLGVNLLESDRARLEHRPTDSVDAYQAYLRGRGYQRYYDRKSLDLAVRLLRQAVELDPEFMEAWSILARAHATLIHFSHDTSPERDRMAREAAERALELDPDSPDAHVAMGFYHYHAHKDYAAAIREFDAAAAIRPDNVDTLFGSALVLRRQGRWDESIRKLERALELDPRDEQALVDLGANYMETGRYREALEELKKAEAIRPDLPWVYFYQISVQYALGDLEASRRLLERLPPSDQESRDWHWAKQLIYERDYEAAATYLDTCKSEWFRLGSVIQPLELLQAWVADLRDDEAEARRLYEIARLRMEDEVSSASDQGIRMRPSLGVAYAGLGRVEDALREGHRSVEVDYPLSRDAVWGDANLYNLAWIQVMVGDSDGAFDSLGKLSRVPQEWFTRGSARHDPRWDALRSDPRWPRLIETMKTKSGR